MSDPKTLNIDLCEDSGGALSRWLWAAHEGQPHDARARVSLGSEDAEGLRKWIESHPLAEGRTIEIHDQGPEGGKKGNWWVDGGEIADMRRYMLQNEDGDEAKELELVIESLYEEGTSGHFRYDEQVKAGYINVGRTVTLSLDSYRPVDESVDYLPRMEREIIDWVLEDPFEGLHCDYCHCCGADISDEVLNAARVLALKIPHCAWENTSTVEVKVDTPLRRSMVLTQKSIQMRSRIRYVDTEAAE